MARRVDDGYSDDGLYSDEDVKPPPNYYLQRRRNAFCVTSANLQLDDDWEVPPPSYLQKRRNAFELPSIAGDLIPEETRVLTFMRERGMKPYFPPARASKEEDYIISSDEEEVYFSRGSDKSQQTSFMRKPSAISKPEVPDDPVTNWKAIADAEHKMKRKVPGFLKYQTPVYRPVENVAPIYASTGTTTDGSSSMPRSGDTRMSPIQTSRSTRTRQTATKAISSAPREKPDFRIM